METSGVHMFASGAGSILMKKSTLKQTFDQLRWYVNIDYDTSHDGCQCDDICRCGRITNARVRSVDVKRFSKDLCRGIPSEIDKYCIDRILTHSGINDVNSFNVTITGGYYGEEIGDVIFKGTSPLPEIGAVLSESTDAKKVLRVLAHEYGYVLPELQSKTKVSVQKIPTALINVGQTSHYRRLNKEAVQRYKEDESTLPKVVVTSNGGRYRLIDGYHRFAAQEEKSIRAIILR